MIDDEQLAGIIRDLTRYGGLRRSRHLAASRALCAAELTEEQRGVCQQKLSAVLGRRLRAQQKVIGWVPVGFVVGMTVVVAMILAWPELYSYDGPVDYWAGVLTLSALFAVITAPVSAPISLFLRSRRILGLRPLVEAIGCVGKSESVPILAKAHQYPELKAAAGMSLTKVLSRLPEGDYGLRSSRSVAALCRALDVADPPAAIAILNVLKLIGDGRAIESVMRVACGPGGEEIERLAREVLGILQYRVTQARSSATLLRPGQSVDGKESGLLQPLQGSPDALSTQLLRATSDE